MSLLFKPSSDLQRSSQVTPTIGISSSAGVSALTVAIRAEAAFSSGILVI